MSNKNTQHSTEITTESITDLQEPTLYCVILHNDDYTPMDFVIHVLMELFDKSYEKAYDIMMEVHLKNRGVAGCYPKEIAAEKVNRVHDIAKNNEFPLTCRIEKI